MTTQPRAELSDERIAIDRLEDWAGRAGMYTDLMRMGAASVVYSPGCSGVVLAELERFAKNVIAADRAARGGEPVAPTHGALAQTRLALQSLIDALDIDASTTTFDVRADGKIVAQVTFQTILDEGQAAIDAFSAPADRAARVAALELRAADEGQLRYSIPSSAEAFRQGAVYALAQLAGEA